MINIESGKKEGCDNVYYSGLYAHWWKKEKLPTQMIEAIAITSQEHDDNQRLKGDDRGSGKENNCLNPVYDVALPCYFLFLFFLESLQK